MNTIVQYHDKKTFVLPPYYEVSGSIKRYCLELLFYFVVFSQVFQKILPISKIPQGIGLLIFITGLFFFVALLTTQKKIPFSLKIAFGINLFVNLTALIIGSTPFVGKDASPHLHWFMFLTMMLFLIQDEKAIRRINFFFVLIISTAVQIGSDKLIGEDVERLELEGVGSSFGNANDLAHMAAIFAISSLFLSFNSSKKFRVFYWASTFLLTGIILKTVSRGALLSLCFGFTVFVFFVLAGKGKRLTGIIIIIIGFICFYTFGSFISSQLSSYRDRLKSDTGRLHVYKLETLNQMLENPIWGSGRDTRIIIRAGYGEIKLTPHNTFIYLFVCYGGIAAMLYMIWMLVLTKRTINAFYNNLISSNIRFMLFSLMTSNLLAHMFSNQGHLFYASIYVTALIEKYTSKY